MDNPFEELKEKFKNNKLLLPAVTIGGGLGIFVLLRSMQNSNGNSSYGYSASIPQSPTGNDSTSVPDSGTEDLISDLIDEINEKFTEQQKQIDESNQAGQNLASTVTEMFNDLTGTVQEQMEEVYSYVSENNSAMEGYLGDVASQIAGSLSSYGYYDDYSDYGYGYDSYPTDSYYGGTYDDYPISMEEEFSTSSNSIGTPKEKTGKGSLETVTSGLGSPIQPTGKIKPIIDGGVQYFEIPQPAPTGKVNAPAQSAPAFTSPVKPPAPSAPTGKVNAPAQSAPTFTSPVKPPAPSAPTGKVNAPAQSAPAFTSPVKPPAPPAPPKIIKPKPNPTPPKQVRGGRTITK